MVDSIGDLDDFEFEVEVQHVVVYHGKYSGAHYHPVQKVLPVFTSSDIYIEIHHA